MPGVARADCATSLPFALLNTIDWEEFAGTVTAAWPLNETVQKYLNTRGGWRENLRDPTVRVQVTIAGVETRQRLMQVLQQAIIYILG